MAAITLVAAILLATAGLAAFDFTALRFGADSRESLDGDRRFRIR